MDSQIYEILCDRLPLVVNVSVAMTCEGIKVPNEGEGVVDKKTIFNTSFPHPILDLPKIGGKKVEK